MVGMDTVMCGTKAERGVGPLQYQFTDIQKVVLAAYGQLYFIASWEGPEVLLQNQYRVSLQVLTGTSLSSKSSIPWPRGPWCQQRFQEASVFRELGPLGTCGPVSPSLGSDHTKP